MDPTVVEPQQAEGLANAPTPHKHKSKFRPSHKGRSRHGKGASVSEDEAGTIKAGRNSDATDQTIVERKEMPRLHSGSGAKAMFDSIFHRRRELWEVANKPRVQAEWLIDVGVDLG
jgi:hypothetical protein